MDALIYTVKLVIFVALNFAIFHHEANGKLKLFINKLKELIFLNILQKTASF